MNKYKIEALSVYKRTFIVEAADDFDAIIDVIQAVERGKMKNGDPLPESVYDMEVPPRAWPVWQYEEQEATTTEEKD